jgi:competence protein ComEA
MHRFKIWIRGFFGFSRKETNAFLILLPLMILILVSEPVYRTWKFSSEDNFMFDKKYTDSVIANLTFAKKDSFTSKTSIHKEIHFKQFDPNKISETEFIALGLSPFLSTRIVRYREKGGRIKKKEDLLKIYGMDSTWFAKASAWIVLPAATDKIATRSDKPVEKKVEHRDPFDINSADSLQLVNVFGIGPALSKRIRSYRDRLGGFISMDQVGEVYGLDTVVLKQVRKKFLVAPGFVPRKVNVNAETVDALISHPYIKRKEAQALINYRRQHGDFKSADDLTQLHNISAAWLERIKPYLTFE